MFENKLEFPGRGGGVQNKKPSVGGVWIFSGILGSEDALIPTLGSEDALHDGLDGNGLQNGFLKTVQDELLDENLVSKPLKVCTKLMLMLLQNEIPSENCFISFS